MRKPKPLIKSPAIDFLSQCPVCKAVETVYGDGRIGYQDSIVEFNSKPKKKCFKHR